MFTGVDHIPYIQRHTCSTPTKPRNGYFDPGRNLDFYQNYMRSFVSPDFVESGSNGRITAFKVFAHTLGQFENHGTKMCESRTGMAVLLNLPDVAHGFPYSHTGAPIRCACCNVILDAIIGCVQ